MAGLSDRPAFDFVLRGNRLDGAGLYFGRRGRLGPVDADRLEPFLREWKARDPYKRMGVIPIMEGGLFDDGAEHEVDALLGDRMVDFSVDDDDVIPGTLRTSIPAFVERKRSAMTAEDEAAFRALAERHGVRFSGLLDGPFEAHLYRTPTFAFGKTPRRVELTCGLGMRPAELTGLPMPAGMEPWTNPGWTILCTKLAEVRRPATSVAVELEAITRGGDAAQAAVDEAAQTRQWRRFVGAAGWGEHDLEVQLYVRLT